MRKERIQWIDIAKGIGILLVCVGHTRLGLGGPIASWITSFHMPLFFVMAGLCFDENRYATYGEYLKRKGAALLYPYFGLTVFIALSFAIFGWGLFGNVFKRMFVDAYPGQTVIGFWFLRVLILTELAYALLAKAIPRRIWRCVAVCGMAIIGFIHTPPPPPLWFGELLRPKVVLVSLLYYEIGQMFRPCLKSTSVHRCPWALGVFGVVFMIQVGLLWLLNWPMTQYGAGVNVVTPVLAVVLALLGTISISAVAMSIEKFGIVHGSCGKAFAWLGRYSICLLAVHPTCGQLRAAWVARWPWMGGGVSYLFELALIVLMMWALAGPLKWFWKMPKRG